MATLIYRIGDINCIGCINRITSALKSIGAIDVDIDFSTHIAKVLTEEENPDENLYLNAIVQTGYQVEYLTTLNEE
ncbi:MAG: hypothetical protein A2Y45_08835 [Tenericutes bacterium GWC2_34_14]|nr:MAG: hypothetical protein A2Z84_04705 [Tenericutes bacterium GWA2_35_7]OHE29996.1 MAG: hypothetical protein A2Y45_08835 [Tenericutes bacterium GWC2_34_14]OHE34975.1 MAG: hypothetical protein A2012_02445 [Tenericutes bacterium GWE2_34_108]OHE37165.1 MAG: hypothetical protein A2Y46_00565 [Tenericutes bacterium GWF1_35_14]OHE39703.1 MAG: hypothetical protein A2Y44_02295 [Tenericutes bacterium GWF2_35_184]OHE44109.1 MAG: hypothetical protein A2221_03215 [Tenericutes bacterium RIFOXYA2_FULL_36_3